MARGRPFERRLDYDALRERLVQIAPPTFKAAGLALGVSPSTVRARLGWRPEPRQRPAPALASDAERIRRLISAAGGVPVSVAELSETTALSSERVIACVGYLRDEGQSTPLVTTYGGYLLTQDMAIVDDYRVTCIRRATTGIRRLNKGVIAPALPYLPIPQRLQIERQVTRLIEDLEAIDTTATPVPC